MIFSYIKYYFYIPTRYTKIILLTNKYYQTSTMKKESPGLWNIITILHQVRAELEILGVEINTRYVISLRLNCLK